MGFSFDLVIPGAETIWTQTVERSDEDVADLLYATPYQYTMRHRFPKPPGAGVRRPRRCRPEAPPIPDERA